MIKVIKHGRRGLTFKTTCEVCGCEFTYELCDIEGNSVLCPDCWSWVTDKKRQPVEDLTLQNNGEE
jgi:hypothetical protein